MEFRTGVAVWWTTNMLREFRSIMGYYFNKYLPLLYSHVSETPGPLPLPDQLYTDDDDLGQSYLDDYFTTVINVDPARHGPFADMDTAYDA